MTTVAMLTLISAIHLVESDGGITSNNHLQITPICLKDTNRILKASGADWRYEDSDRFDLVKSRGIAIVYMNHYGQKLRKRTGKEPTAKDYAIIFHLGYRGYFDARRKTEADRYWREVRKNLKDLEVVK